jgi:hypothetical protein
MYRIKKARKNVSIPILMLLILVVGGLMSACGSALASSEAGEHVLVGEWISSHDGLFWYDFRADGTGTRGIRPNTETFSWAASGGDVTMVFGFAAEVWGYSLDRQGNTATFTNEHTPGYIFVFNRQ